MLMFCLTNSALVKHCEAAAELQIYCRKVNSFIKGFSLIEFQPQQPTINQHLQRATKQHHNHV